MDRIFLAALLIFTFIAGFLGRDIASFITGKPKKKKASSASEKIDTQTLQSSEKSEEEFHVLGKMGYFLASNDEDKMPAYSASPLQDLDPKDLA